MGLEQFELIGESPPMQDLERDLRRVAPTDATVTRRERHRQGAGGQGHPSAWSRSQAALRYRGLHKYPGDVDGVGTVGHEAGAFTHARTRKQGVIEGAAGGTLFLDEIALLPNPLQAKLLHVLETRRFRALAGIRRSPLR